MCCTTVYKQNPENNDKGFAYANVQILQSDTRLADVYVRGLGALVIDIRKKQHTAQPALHASIIRPSDRITMDCTRMKGTVTVVDLETVVGLQKL